MTVAGRRCPACGAPFVTWITVRDRDGGPPRRLERCTGTGCGLARTVPAAPVHRHPAAGHAPGGGRRASGQGDRPGPTAGSGSAPPAAPGRGGAQPTGHPARGAPARPSRAFSGDTGGRLAALVVRRQLAPLIARLAPASHVVDLGAGAGLRAAVLADAGMRVTAVEPDAGEWRRLRDRTRPRVTPVRATLEAACGMITDADAAVMWHVLEHTVDPVAALTAARAALRPGGTLMLAVPNAASWEARAARGRWHSWDPSRHRWHLTVPAVAALLVRAGLTEIRVGTRGGWGYPASLAYTLAPGLDPQAGARRPLPGMALAGLLAPLVMLETAAGRGPQVLALARAPGVAGT